MSLQADRDASLQMGPSLDFWRKFADQTWERTSEAFPNLFLTPPITPEMAFDAAAQLADAARGGQAVIAPCVWLDGRKQADPLPYMPLASDGSFELYADRLLKMSGAEEFTALFPELHYYSSALLCVIRQIAQCIVYTCGLPAGWSDTTFFVGQYKKTPFGVHDGPMSVLTLPVIGRKTFRLWSAEEITGHPELVAATFYDPALSRSKCLEADPGGMIYWPAREWHIAEADSGLTAALSVGFWTAPQERHPLRQVVSMAERLMASADRDGAPEVRPLPDPKIGGEGRLPRAWKQRLDTLSEIISSGLLETELIAEHLRQASAFGLKHVPRQLPKRISRTAPVALDALAGLTVARQNATLLIAVYGQVFTVPNDPHLEQLLSILSDREVHFDALSALFPSRASSLSVEDGWLLLEHLAYLGAVAEVRR